MGRNRTVQVVRKHCSLQFAAVKTIYRSQGDTETRSVINFQTTRAIPDIHYTGLSRVTSIEGLFITDPCEHEIGHLRTEGRLSLSKYVFSMNEHMEEV